MNEIKPVAQEKNFGAVEAALVQNDLSKLNPEECLMLYKKTCESLGLNPLTQPFGYLELNNKLTLYCKKDATDQLRKINHISVEITSRQMIDGVYIVTAKATDARGRTDESIGAVPLSLTFFDKRTNQKVTRPLGPDELANATMKAETKAKRRVTLSICGLGLLDETDTETIPEAKIVDAKPESLEASGAPIPKPQPQAQTSKADSVIEHAKSAFDFKFRTGVFEGKTMREIPPDELVKVKRFAREKLHTAKLAPEMVDYLKQVVEYAGIVLDNLAE